LHILKLSEYLTNKHANIFLMTMWFVTYGKFSCCTRSKKVCIWLDWWVFDARVGMKCWDIPEFIFKLMQGLQSPL